MDRRAGDRAFNFVCHSTLLTLSSLASRHVGGGAGLARPPRSILPTRKVERNGGLGDAAKGT
jgi:hypothetical protein